VEELFGLLDSLLLLRAERHRFEIATGDRSGCLFIDPQRIKQVLENLIGNAAKYSPAGSVIRIDGAVEGNVYRLSVRDLGIGMTPEQVEKAFEKFYRADASSTSPGGIGLGMGIAKSIVELHGGRIRVESSPGRGTRVSIHLPLGTEQEVAGREEDSVRR